MKFSLETNIPVVQLTYMRLIQCTGPEMSRIVLTVRKDRKSLPI